MPIVQVHLKGGRSHDKKRKLVQEMTRVICETLDVAPEKVRIILSEMAPENYAIAGKLMLDQKDSLVNKTTNKG